MNLKVNFKKLICFLFDHKDIYHPIFGHGSNGLYIHSIFKMCKRCGRKKFKNWSEECYYLREELMEQMRSISGVPKEYFKVERKSGHEHKGLEN